MLDILREYMRRRTLVWVLTRRSLIARYRGTSLGFLWTFLHPLLLFGVYALVFGIYVRVPVSGGPYAAFLIAGLLPWTWFASSVSIATTSTLADAPWIRQGAFSPAISPLVTSVSTLVNFALTVPILLLVLLALGVKPTVWLAALPLIVLLQFAFQLGFSLATSALSVRYRDTIQLLQAILPIWFFLTPVIYPASLVPEPYTWLLRLNPLTHLAGAYQDVFFAGRAPDPVGLAIMAGWAGGALLVGSWIFQALRDRIPEEL